MSELIHNTYSFLTQEERVKIIISRKEKALQSTRKSIQKRIENSKIDNYLINRMLKKICVQLKITLEDYLININKRKSIYVEARTYLAYILNKKYCYNEYQIAKVIQKRDPSNISECIEKIEFECLHNNTKKNYLKLFMIEC